MVPITDLQFLINASEDSLIKFDPAVKTYHVTIPTDCFGALLKLQFAPEFYISIRSDRDAGRFGFETLEPEMGDYIAGTEIPYYDYYGGYIIRLDKRESCFANDLDAAVTIDAGSAEHGTDRYEIHIHRDSGKTLRDLFREESFYDEEFQITMPYKLYVPGKYDRRKKYPMVICLHGTGEVQEPIDSVLMKTQMATVFAEDSEAGRNECFVLVPKCNVRYDKDDNWTTLNQFVRQRTDSPFWPMPHLTVVWRLIGKLMNEYKIDDRRLYLTGISSGAFGAYVLAMEHFQERRTRCCADGRKPPICQKHCDVQQRFLRCGCLPPDPLSREADFLAVRPLLLGEGLQRRGDAGLAVFTADRRYKTGEEKDRNTCRR